MFCILMRTAGFKNKQNAIHTGTGSRCTMLINNKCTRKRKQNFKESPLYFTATVTVFSERLSGTHLSGEPGIILWNCLGIERKKTKTKLTTRQKMLAAKSLLYTLLL